MTELLKKTKPPEWSFRDLLDGRYAIERNGITVRVFHSRDEAVDWWKTIVAGENLPTIPLGIAIGRL
jgi:hypothetical protein